MGNAVSEPLERRVEELEQRLRRLEARVPAPAPRPVGWVRSEEPETRRPVPPPRPPRAPAPRPAAPASPRSSRSWPALEELLGGRLLAWGGGLAVLLGVAFFVAVAIGRGWIDEPTRIGLAFAGSLGLLAAGVWLHERRGATQAARAMVATAIGSLYLVVTAATQLYHLFPIPAALPLAFAIGALACAVAVRWDSPVIGGLGILGALAAPVLVGAGSSGLAIGFVAVALASAAGVLVWRGWEWLSIAAFAVTAPQLIAWTFESPGAGALLVVPVIYWALYLVAAIGHEVRAASERPRGSSACLVSLAGILAGASAYWGLVDTGHPGLGELSLAVLALGHLAVGAWALRSSRVARPLALLLLGGAVTLGDVAFGLVADGPVVAVGWAVGAAGLALAGRVSRRDAEVVRLGLTAQMLLAISHVLLFDATPRQLVEGGGDLVGGLLALGIVATAAVWCARSLRNDAVLRVGGDVLAMLTLAYASAFAFSGTALVVAWGAQAIALAGTARRWRDEVAWGGAVGFLALALLHALVVEAPPASLVDGAPDLARAAGALAAVALAALALGRSAIHRRPGWRLGAEATALVSGLYLASIAIVTAFQPDGGALASPFAGLGVRQQGQVMVSALWAVVGLAVLVWGLLRDEPRRRAAGLGLLVLAIGKVFLYDVATLESLYRVLSLVGCGLLLLAGAFAYQRMRRRDTPRAAV